MDRRTFLKSVARAAAVAGAAQVLPRAGEAAEPPARLTLVAVGDCILARRISEIRDPGFLAVRELLRGADCVWGNCETVFADPRQVSPAPKGEDPSAICEPWGVDELRWMGLGLMGTANNHALDYGTEGMLATLANLDRVGIVHAGSGADLAQAARPAYFDAAAGRVGLVNCASSYPDFFAAAPAHPWVKGRPGVNPLKVESKVELPRTLFDQLRAAEKELEALWGYGEFAEMLKDAESRQPKDTALFVDTVIAPGERVDWRTAGRKEDVRRITEAVGLARQLASVVVASIHAHEARQKLELSDLFLQPFAHACVDAGADLYVSAGPHVLRGIEIYKGKPIFYSLGNFFFQYETEPQIPAEAFVNYGLDSRTLDTWQYNQKITYHKERRFWQSVVPRITYEGGKAVEVELHPITLGFGEPVYLRGTPRLAVGEEARSILENLARLSQPYGTTIAIEDGVGRVKLG